MIEKSVLAHKTKLRDLSLRANYTDRATAALSTKLVTTFADRGCHVVSVTDPYGRILDFLDRSCYFFFQVLPQLYSRGWEDPVPEPPLLRKSGSAGNRIRTSRSVASGCSYNHEISQACYGTPRFTTMSCPYPEPNESSSHVSHHIYLKSILILSFNLNLGFPSGLFPSHVSNKTSTAALTHECYIPCPSHPSWFDLSKNIWWTASVV
jgi:hypothetical protein